MKGKGLPISLIVAIVAIITSMALWAPAQYKTDPPPPLPNPRFVVKPDIEAEELEEVLNTEALFKCLQEVLAEPDGQYTAIWLEAPNCEILP